MSTINCTNKYPSDTDIYLFHEGKHHQAYSFMGAHLSAENNQTGVRFTTWAPNATRICVIGDFSSWELSDKNNMTRISDAGIWSVFIPEAQIGMKYKFAVFNDNIKSMVYKADPFGQQAELRPGNASIIASIPEYQWHDNEWLSNRSTNHEKPMSVYEVHLASWKTKNNWFLSYDELSQVLPQYVKNMGFTHVELMPLHEHPLDKSWGYQAVGYYAPTSRHHDVVGLKKLIDKFHELGIGVILDWVAGHFCTDQHGLINFDGTPTYEYQDYNKANNKGWGAHNFDLGRNEVKSFLISNALYWINEFHIDGLRVDAVSNIIYLNYDRNDGEWSPNIQGGNENLEGTGFLKELNWTLHHYHPSIITVAEESSSWPGITTSVYDNGLGFDYKWNMGWMNDTLRYMELDPIHRQYHHNLINFSMIYHHSENFVLSISHDEVVHGKKSLANKMPGDLWQKYANLRAYIGFMFGHPGKKLLFMGNEIAQFVEWREYEELQWNIVNEFPIHKQVQDYFRQINQIYQNESSLWQADYDNAGFRWIDGENNQQSIVSFARFSKNHNETIIVVSNFTPNTYHDYQLGAPSAGNYQEILNSDDTKFGGSGQLNQNTLTSNHNHAHGFNQAISLTIPPLATLFIKYIGN